MSPEPQSSAEDEEPDPWVSRIVADKYRVERLLGRGGMGAVYQATNLGIGKRVALKFLDAEAARDPDASQRFQREALAASLAESAHIVQIFDSGTAEHGAPFLVMELLEGEDLRARLKREGRLSEPVAVEIVRQVLRALSRAHAAGIVHRDLKPDNVFLCERDDGALFAKVLDFGISKLERSASPSTLTRRGTVLGTAFYMSPEQAQAEHDIDGRADLWSVGAILFECLAGRPPHQASTYEAVLISICTRAAENVRRFAPNVSPALGAVVAKALSRTRAERYQSAGEFLAVLGHAPNTQPASSGGQSEPGTGTPTRRESARTWVTGALAALAGFALVAAWLAVRARPAEPEPPAPTALGAERARPTAEQAPEPPSVVPVAPVASTPAPPSASAPQSARPAARDKPGKSGGKARRGGVAGKLELSTREP